MKISLSIKLLNAWLHFTNNNFPTLTSVKEILDQPVFLNSQSKLITCFIEFHPWIFQTKLLLFIRDLCRCLQPCLISSTTFAKKWDFTTSNYIKEYINLLWTWFLMVGNAFLKMELLKRKILFKALHPYKDTRKVKDFQKISNI